MDIKWVLFDLGNTLYDETLSDRERVYKLIHNNNLDISVDEFIEQMKVEAKNYAESPFTAARKHYGIRANQEYSCERRCCLKGFQVC